MCVDLVSKALKVASIVCICVSEEAKKVSPREGGREIVCVSVCKPGNIWMQEDKCM